MRPLRTLARVAVVLGLVAGLGLSAATAAQAHNVLLKTNPASGSTVAKLPANVVLTFNLPALNIGAAMQVVGPNGDVADGKPALVDTTVSEAVQPGAPAGAYKVTWRVTSADGHPISGTFAFTAKAGDGGTAPTGPTATADPAGPVVSAATPQSTTSSGVSGAHVAIIVVVVILLIAVVLGVLLALRRRRDLG